MVFIVFTTRGGKKQVCFAKGILTGTLEPHSLDISDEKGSCIAGSEVWLRCAFILWTKTVLNGIKILQYKGPCVPNMSFKKMDKNMKVQSFVQCSKTASLKDNPNSQQQLMETHCLLAFPCTASCPVDYSRPWYVRVLNITLLTNCR